MKPTADNSAQPADSRTGSTGRARWHRRAGLLPLAYLAALVAIALIHPLLPSWRWLAIHLLLLGAVTNAIVVWSAHFTTAVLRAPAPADRRGEAFRLAVLNAGVVGVLAGGATDQPWPGVVGAGLVFAAVLAHLRWLGARLRVALPARFAVTVHYYVAAAAALLVGVPVGAWMLVVDDDSRPRLLLFHAHVNLLGWRCRDTATAHAAKASTATTLTMAAQRHTCSMPAASPRPTRTSSDACSRISGTYNTR
jgi:hypothetical protein